MSKPAKLIVLVVLVVVVGVVLAAKQGAKCPCCSSPPVKAVASAPTSQAAKRLPKLLDLGADKCVPCKMMAPILDELEKTYAGQFEVEFIDVWKDRDAADKHNVRVIPTQIFFDADGKERFRHEGFFGKEDILKKWKELGVTLKKTGSK